MPVTLGVFFINVLWLFPFALAVGLGMVDALLGVFVAYLPLILIAAAIPLSIRVSDLGSWRMGGRDIPVVAHAALK